jgi:6-phosphogluconolactonase
MATARTFDTARALTHALVGVLTRHLQHPPHPGTPSAVMLAGGRTPLAAYDHLARHPFQVAPTAHVLLSDERMAPRDTEASNYFHMKSMFSALGLTADRILAVETDYPTEAAARDYDDGLRNFLEAGGRITLGLLGLGADGHTASLFSPSDLERSRGRLAVSVRRPDGRDGVSVTPGLIRCVERVLFVVTGSAKKEVAKALLEDPLSLPAGLATADHPSVDVWLDAAAHPDASGAPEG